ncbi:MAG: helix-turn-helix domain-containing protein [Oscillospiraceae bacterium]
MELNEKIFAERRKAGLSQEELAGKLGVSRQAVGKWENGTATPDISNLIALSEVFNVSVGELLGTETAGVPGAAPSAGVTHEELKRLFMEQESAAFRRRQEHEEKSRRDMDEFWDENGKQRKLQLFLFGALALAVLVLGILGARRISRLEDELRSLRSDTIGNMNDLILNMNDMQSSITGLLEAQASLFSDFSFDVTDYDAVTGDVMVSLSVTPKSITDTLQVELQLEEASSGTVLRGEAKRSGAGFTAELAAPKGEYTVTAVLADNGTQQSEKLGRCSASPIGLEARYNLDWLSGEDYVCGPNEDRPGFDYRPCGIIIITCEGGSMPARKISTLTLELYKNGELADTVTLDSASESGWMQEYTSPEWATPIGTGTKQMTYTAPENGYLFVGEFDFGTQDVVSGDSFRLSLTMEDALGLQYAERDMEMQEFRQSSVAGHMSAGHINLDYEQYE